jgi:hypothetical protein
VQGQRTSARRWLALINRYTLALFLPLAVLLPLALRRRQVGLLFRLVQPLDHSEGQRRGPGAAAPGRPSPSRRKPSADTTGARPKQALAPGAIGAGARGYVKSSTARSRPIK